MAGIRGVSQLAALFVYKKRVVCERGSADLAGNVIHGRNKSPFSHRSGETGVLMIHGFTGSPGELRPLGEFLGAHGYAVETPVLAGHCTSVEDMMETTDTDWLQSAHDAYLALAKDVKQVVVIGHSMGGLIAFHLANRNATLGVVSICTPIYLTNPLTIIAPYLAWAMPVQKGKGPRNPQVQEFLGGYNDTPLKTVKGLRRLIEGVKAELPRVVIPTLIQQSNKDITVRPKSATYIYDQISSTKKYLKWYANSGHILPVDVDRAQVFADILSFVREIEGSNDGD
jgi:carboxylesterase